MSMGRVDLIATDHNADELEYIEHAYVWVWGNGTVVISIVCGCWQQIQNTVLLYFLQVHHLSLIPTLCILHCSVLWADHLV